MWLSDRKQLWSIGQNISLFKANLEECEIGLQKKEEDLRSGSPSGRRLSPASSSCVQAARANSSAVAAGIKILCLIILQPNQLIINILQASIHFSAVYIVPLCNGGFADFKDFVAYLDGISILLSYGETDDGWKYQ